MDNRCPSWEARHWKHNLSKHDLASSSLESGPLTPLGYLDTSSLQFVFIFLFPSTPRSIRQLPHSLVNRNGSKQRHKKKRSFAVLLNRNRNSSFHGRHVALKLWTILAPHERQGIESTTYLSTLSQARHLRVALLPLWVTWIPPPLSLYSSSSSHLHLDQSVNFHPRRCGKTTTDFFGEFVECKLDTCLNSHREMSSLYNDYNPNAYRKRLKTPYVHRHW